MKKTNWSIVSLSLSAFFASSATFATTQTIITSSPNIQATSGDTIEFDVIYSASSPQQTTGLGISLYFDSEKLTLINTSEVFSKSIIAQDAHTDNENGDNNIATDRKITIAWADLNGSWPGTKNGDTNLLKVKFNVAQDFISSTSINITGDASAGNTFIASPITINSADTAQDDTPKTIKTTTGSPPENSSSSGSVTWLLIPFLMLGIIRRKMLC